MTRTLATSPDGQWAAARDGRMLSLLPATGGPPLGTVELDSEDVDVALVGPPASLVIVARDGTRAQVTLYQPPQLEPAARLELETPAKVVAATGGRLALVTPDSMHLAILRAAGRGLALQKLEVTGPIEFVVGMERNQVLLGLPKKLEVWDAVSGRPLLRPQFQLPPAPRVLGTAAGHMWAMRKSSDEIFVYRLSDGRPFRHQAGSTIIDVVSHPASPVIVLVTERGLARLHCFAHSLVPVDGAPESRGALALVANGEDVQLVGYVGDGRTWRVAVNGTAPTVEAPPPAPIASPAPVPAPPRPTASNAWREALATAGAELAKSAEVEVPAIQHGSTLGELAHRLGLGLGARRALAALYALHLVGVSETPIAQLAKLADDWAEALGQGELGALAMLRRKRGRVGLRTAVTDLLDGASPRHVRLVGSVAATPRAGAFRVARDGRADAAIESELAAQLGRIAIVEGSLRSGLLEARLHGATAVTMRVPDERPSPWPRDAGLVLVLYGAASSWVADIPPL
ncbi:MAG: hypothetical protein HOV81_09395 [Kofleriaceae bacterium]|nr:hypothetical protein [Kofleriaceae bacterium]